MNGSVCKVAMGTWVCMIFNKAEDVWQLKWPPLTHLAWNWQLASLAYRIAGNVCNFRDPRPKPDNRNREIRNRKNLNIIFGNFKPADDVLPFPMGHLSSSVSPATIKGRGQ